MQTVLSNVDQAIDFVISAEKEHPNRIDICRASTAGPGSASSSLSQGSSTIPFAGTQSQTTPFGTSTQPTISAAFGAPSTAAQTGAFGQPSALGQKPSPFGGTTPAFGAPSQLGAAGVFGRPSSLGQNPNPFGAPSGAAVSSTSTTNAAPFSAFARTATTFSQPQQQQTANPFGAPSNLPTSSSFAATPQPAQQTPFGLKPAQNSNLFGSTEPPSQQNPFGTTNAPFGAPSSRPENPFGQPSTRPPAVGGNLFSNAANVYAESFWPRFCYENHDLKPIW